MESALSILGIAAAAFLAGALVSRYVRKTGETARRRQRLGGHSVHFTLGFNYLTTGEIEKAVEALRRIASTEVEAVEARLILGNLLREKGRVEAAVALHEEVLKKSGLTEDEKTLTLFCLALDFRKGGFIDRSMDLFLKVLDRDPDNLYALRYLEKLYEEEKNWEQACAVQKRIEQASGQSGSVVLAFLETQMGLDALSRNDAEKARGHFEKAIEIDPRVIAPYIHMGELYFQQKKFNKAKSVWETMLKFDPKKLHLVSSKLEEVYRFQGEYDRMKELILSRLEKSPDDWRAHLMLGEIEESAQNFDVAFSHYKNAIRHNQHSFPLHRRMWNLLSKMEGRQTKIRQYLDLCEDVVTLGDPHVCIRCHYLTTDWLWRCPSCHEWNTFVEELR
jgi:lipopolysaccharide biosynthesis regulator YciM